MVCTLRLLDKIVQRTCPFCYTVVCNAMATHVSVVSPVGLKVILRLFAPGGMFMAFVVLRHD